MANRLPACVATRDPRAAKVGVERGCIPMSIARHVAIVGTATLASRVLGFVRDVAIAGLFGAGMRAPTPSWSRSSSPIWSAAC